jgi:hypothetical protein
MTTESADAQGTSKSVYVLVRSRCRSAGIHMEQAADAFGAFHQLQLHSLSDVAGAIKAEADKLAGKVATTGESKETKAAEAELKAAVQILVDKVEFDPMLRRVA